MKRCKEVRRPFLGCLTHSHDLSIIGFKGRIVFEGVWFQMICLLQNILSRSPFGSSEWRAGRAA